MKPVVRITLKVVAVSAVFIVIALLLAQDQETLRIQSSIPATDPSFIEYVADLTGPSPTRRDRYDILVNGDQIFPPMLDAIANAKRRISLETYIYSTGKVASEFTEALVRAASRGVEVRAVIDAIGSSDIDDEQVKRLTQAGVEISWFNPPDWYTLEELNFRTHRKILVVDGAVGFVGGAGMSDHWIGNADSKEHWRDMQVRVAGPAARLLEAAFYENWIESGNVVKPVLDREEQAPVPDQSTRSVVVWSSPTGGSNDMKLLYLLSIAGAQQTIDISTPYFVTDESSRWVIEEAIKRNVKIRLLTEGEITDAKAVKFASRAHYEQLLEQGIEIYEYEPTMMHAKAMMVDGVWSVVGSSNFDNRSLELNDEVNIGIQDREVARQLTAQFDVDLQKSRRLSLETWRRRSVLEKTRERFWSFFGELF
jgi:cardiolipin synthase